MWDEILSLVSNVFLVIPALPLLVVLLGELPQKGQTATILVLSLLGWPWGARVIRAQTLAIRNRDFIAAARETGERTWRILAFEIVPNQVSLIAANFVNTVLYAIGASVALAFIGLTNLSSWSLGTMLYWAQSQDALQLGAWWWFVPPGLAVALIGTSLVLLNTGIDELSNPRLRDARSASQDRRAGGSARPSRRRCWPTSSRAGRRSPRSCTRSPARRSWTGTGSDDSAAASTSWTEPVLDISDFSVAYRTAAGDVRAVDHVNLTLHAGEVVGLAGESGSGKSTLAYGATRLLRPPALITSGTVTL